MNGKLDVEEDVMDDSVIANRKAAAVMKTVSGKLSGVIATLGWDCYDDVVVEIGGTVVSGIHQGEDYNKKWATPYGVRKYNKDAFIVIKIAHVLHLNHQNLFQRVNSNHVILMR